ncbi:PLC-like phosphodiesterase [Teratosphaeria nubilosa]|uniref:PLC-like phosphodiesterase n=1 Tax=Teratosphaeria nubilosa TaxID=161662 RepID=A0A6G1LMJ2_9PEZI|nr:PLC-like phosphodiesterase [Teratosphaeria nubilosa]
MPQCIAHRGYKAKHPENTMAAFKGAVKAGAHAIETDLHVTKDEVVVISHDATLKRCFGRPDKIKDKTWDEIKDLTTTSEPHEPMPRLLDLLAYLSEPGLEDIWILLDIKLDNDADQIMRLIASTIASATPASKRKWEDCIVLGIWAAKFLPLALKYSPGFPVVHIGFSTSYARHFLQIPDVGFNMLLPILIGPGGQSFLREARETFHRRVIAWTVNTEDRMESCIRRELDGVITDDPEMFLRMLCVRAIELQIGTGGHVGAVGRAH